jgi:hypothetical protein
VVFCLLLQEGLREELLFYWKTLTSEPLYVTDAAANEALQTSKITLSENARIISELDTADAMHLTEKEMKHLKFKDRVKNFDIVEEMVNSMEAWTNIVHPTGRIIAQAIFLVSEFLAEFCRFFETSAPPFLRLMMTASAFEEFKISLICNLNDINENGQESHDNSTTAKVKDSGSPNAGNNGANVSIDGALVTSGKKKRSNVIDDAQRFLSKKGAPVGNNVFSLSKEVIIKFII